MVFPRDYEKWQNMINEDARVFIQGRVSAEDDKASKLILEKVRPFSDIPRELWILSLIHILRTDLAAFPPSTSPLWFSLVFAAGFTAVQKGFTQ